MIESWVHIGRLWTNGEPYLAVDAELRMAWRGWSDDYREALLAALDFPHDQDEVGESLSVPSGKLAVFSAAVDDIRFARWLQIPR